MESLNPSYFKLNLNLEDASVYYLKDFLTPLEADFFYNKFNNDLEWQQHHIKLFGKTIAQPRLTALYAENTKPYTYSHLTLQPKIFTPELNNLKQKIHEFTDIKYSHCLANLYRNGNDSMGWHSDDEKELGRNPAIASLSLGCTRKFQFKHKFKDLKYTLELETGSLLLMKDSTQHYWKHQIPKTSAIISARINLTFRNIL